MRQLAVLLGQGFEVDIAGRLVVTTRTVELHLSATYRKLARVLRGNASAAVENVALWDERTHLHELLEAADLGLDLDTIFDLRHFTRHARTIVDSPGRGGL